MNFMNRLNRLRRVIPTQQLKVHYLYKPNRYSQHQGDVPAAWSEQLHLAGKASCPLHSCGRAGTGCAELRIGYLHGKHL